MLVSFTVIRYITFVGAVSAGLGTEKPVTAPLATAEQNARRSSCPPPPMPILMGLSLWSVARKQSCPAASFCWLRSVMFVAVTLVQFWACPPTHSNACDAQKQASASREIFFILSPGMILQKPYPLVGASAGCARPQCKAGKAAYCESLTIQSPGVNWSVLATLKVPLMTTAPLVFSAEVSGAKVAKVRPGTETTLLPCCAVVATAVVADMRPEINLPTRRGRCIVCVRAAPKSILKITAAVRRIVITPGLYLKTLSRP